MSNIKEIEKQTQIAAELGHTYHKYDLDDAKEYLKWLSFIPKFQQENIDNILKKDKDNLTQEEECELREFKMQQEILPKFRNYVSNTCQSDDFLNVQCYMGQVNIEKVISTKLTDSDYEAAEILIEEVTSYPVDKALRFIELLKSFSVITPAQMYALHELNKIFKQNTYDKAGKETLKYICENDNEISKKFK